MPLLLRIGASLAVGHPAICRERMQARDTPGLMFCTCLVHKRLGRWIVMRVTYLKSRTSDSVTPETGTEDGYGASTRKLPYSAGKSEEGESSDNARHTRRPA